MIIESKPMLERTKRAYEAYKIQLENARESWMTTDTGSDKIDNINLELELSDEMIRAIDNEIANKHESD